MAKNNGLMTTTEELEATLQSSTPIIRIDGLNVEQSNHDLPQETIQALSLLVQATGVSSEILVGKILGAALCGNENFTILKLYRQLAHQHQQKQLKQELSQIEQLKSTKQKELAILEQEIQNRLGE